MLGFESWQSDQIWPYDSAILDATDATTLSLLDLGLGSTSANDLRWLSVDDHGNTFMHIFATTKRPKSLAWLLNQSFSPSRRGIWRAKQR